MKEKEVVLNIGCGPDDIRKNCINIDVKDYPKVDLVCNALAIPMKAETVDYIIAQHILEYIPRIKMIDVLNEWKRLLKPEHNMEIRVVDLGQLTKAMYLNQVSSEMGLHAEMVISQIYGEQRHEWDIRYNGFTSEYLQGILRGVGFEIIGLAIEGYDVIVSVQKPKHDEEL